MKIVRIRTNGDDGVRGRCSAHPQTGTKECDAQHHSTKGTAFFLQQRQHLVAVCAAVRNKLGFFGHRRGMFRHII